MDAATIIGYIILNIAILFGTWIVIVIAGAIFGACAVGSDRFEGGWSGAIAGAVLGVIVCVIGVVISLIVWARWLI